jgi:hypothetical protein
VDLDEFDESFDAEVGECENAVVSDAIDPDDAVLGIHFESDVVNEVDTLTEAFGDALDGRDVIDLVDVHAQAASADAR